MNFRLNFSSITFLLLFPVKNSITLQKGFRLSLSVQKLEWIRNHYSYLHLPQKLEEREK